MCLAHEKSLERSRLAQRMRSQSIDFYQAKSPFVHAKTIEIDDQILFI